MKTNFCYLDNAATSFPKPQNVSREVARCINTYCGNAGRGSHKLSLLAANKIYDCRESICNLINAPTPENIVFVPSCTFGLNLIIKGILKQGDHVLISDMEHNSVYRPIAKLQKEGKITFDIFSALSLSDKSEDKILNSIKNKLRKNTKLVICNHQSNICSYALPIEKIGAFCKENHILFAVDSAQSMGHLPIDIQKMNIDFLCAPGHKGLYGLQGSAFIACNTNALPDTLIEGGNGINSLEPYMTDIIPERYEIGTLPLPCIVGLSEGIKEVSRTGTDYIRKQESELYKYARDGLMNIKNVRVYAPNFEGSTLLFNVDSLTAEKVSSALDEQNICSRAGFHCTPLAHTALGTQSTGAVRISFGIFNTKSDIDKLLSCVSKTVHK